MSMGWFHLPAGLGPLEEQPDGNLTADVLVENVHWWDTFEGPRMETRKIEGCSKRALALPSRIEAWR